MKLELKSISIWSAVKIGFVVNLVMGFIMGLLFALFLAPFLALTASFMPAPGVDGTQMEDMSIGALIVIMPLMYSIASAIFGTIAFAIGAGVYNLTARLLGGIEYTSAEVQPELPYGSYPATPGPYPPYTPSPGPQYPPAGSPSPYAPNVAPRQPMEPRPAPPVTPAPTPPPPGDRPSVRPSEEPPAPPQRPDDQSDETDKPLG